MTGSAPCVKIPALGTRVSGTGILSASTDARAGSRPFEDWKNMSLFLTYVPLAAAPPQPSMLPSFLMMAVIFGIFYLLVFAPMRKKQKKHAEMVDALKSGDRVITNGGILGTVVGITDDIIQLRIADQVRIEISKNAIAALQHPKE